MKKTFAFAVLVSAVCMFALSFNSFAAKKTGQAAAPAKPAAAQPAAPAVTAFQQTNDWNKLDGDMQQAWISANQPGGDKTTRIDCFVRVDAPPDRGDESFLFSKGFVVRMFAGPVATGHMTVADLPDVAALPFVRSIKNATK